MYGKLFTQMYDGTLATKGPWQAMVTFQQFVILADKAGHVDMTAEAISRRTTIPLEIIKIGIASLEQDDAESRTPAEDGKRIVLLSADRTWGWRIVNYEHYRKIRSQEERREYMRNYQQKRRAQSKPDVNNVSNVNQSSKQEVESNKSIVGKNGHDVLDQSKEILEYLNRNTGKAYRPVASNLKLIQARLKSGVTPLQMREVIYAKCSQWGKDERMMEYLRPATLFNATKFEQYLGEFANGMS